MSAGVLNSSHKTLDDRLSCAQNMIKRHNFQIPCYVDDMENSYRDTYSAWPFRIYGFKKGKVFYKSGIDDSEYDPDELFSAIQLACE